MAVTEINAQNATSSIRDSINYIFTELDTNSIPSGILYEKASPSLKWSYFSGKNDSLTNISIWKGMYKVLRNGSVHESNNFISDDSFNDLFSEARNADLIPICILNYNYEQLKPFVIDSNLLVVNGKQLYDVNERSQSPYTTNKLFNATAGFNVYYGDTAKFVFSQDYYFTNDTSSIQKIEIDFDDGGGYRLTAFGDTIQ